MTADHAIFGPLTRVCRVPAQAKRKLDFQWSIEAFGVSSRKPPALPAWPLRRTLPPEQPAHAKLAAVRNPGLMRGLVCINAPAFSGRLYRFRNR